MRLEEVNLQRTTDGLCQLREDTPAEGNEGNEQENIDRL
jgi:hypothetical protein